MTLEQLTALGLTEADAKKVLEAMPKDNDKGKGKDKETDELQAELERLRKHVETLLGEKKAETDKRRAEQAEKERLEQEQARKKGDFDAIEAQYKDKIANLENQIKEQTAQRHKDLTEAQALKLASQLSANPHNQELLQVFIKNRLTVDEQGQIKVTDTSGNPTINTLDELVGEFKKSGRYDSLIDGTQASGTGATGQGVKAAAEYSEAERVALAQSNPQMFNQLFNQ